MEADTVIVALLQMRTPSTGSLGDLLLIRPLVSGKPEFEPRESGSRAPNHDIILPPFNDSHSAQGAISFSHVGMLWRNWMSNVWKMGLNNKKYTVGCGYWEVLENSNPELKAKSTAYPPYNPQPHFFKDDTRFNHLFENPLEL